MTNLNPAHRGEKRQKKRNLYLSIFIGTAVIAAIAIFFLFKKDSAIAETVPVRLGSITQDVLVTGKSKPIKDVELAFEKGGKIQFVYFKTGARVNAGSAIIKLDSRELNAQLSESEAALKSEKLKLQELKIGTRDEEIKIAEVKVSSALSALQDAKQNLVDKLNDAYTKSDDAVRSKLDQLFSYAGTSGSNLKISNIDNTLKYNVESERTQIEVLLQNWKKLTDGFSLEQDLSVATQISRANLNEVKNLSEILTGIAHNLTPDSSLSQSTIDGYKADISSARTTINTAITNLSAAEEKLRSSEGALKLSENELVLKKAGSTNEQIASQEARIDEANARIKLIQTQISKTSLISPITGMITLNEAEIGEIVAANEIIVKIISETGLLIEADVPEVDIGHVNVGNPVKITFDAFPNEIFSGKVSEIDPAETIVDGVVNFGIKIEINGSDSRLKSGLTANLEIQTLSKNNVLILPQFTVIERDEGAFVKKISGGIIEEVPVVLGIRGSDGNIEIISGLTAGDEVLNIGAR